MADQAERIKGVADIVFLIDSTGSMKPCIDALKRNIGAFIGSLTTSGPNEPSPIREWRARVVGFRDFEKDGANWVINQPFVSDKAALEVQLAAVAAAGGDDEPESLLDALYLVAATPATAKGAPLEEDKWRYASAAHRFVIVFTDATFKEPMAIPEAAGGRVQDVSTAIEQARVKLFVFAPDEPGYEALSKTQRTEFYPIKKDPDYQHGLANFTADQANFSKVMEQLGKTVNNMSQVEPVKA
jgi:hypothetical protein